MKKAYLLVATFFYVGYLPRMPGTFASAAGMVLFYGTRSAFSPLAQLMILLALVVIGIRASTHTAGLLNEKDPAVIVIDELAGIGIALYQIPFSLPLWIVAFFLFRLLDIFKPWPIKPLENLRGGVGIMMDDCAAGLVVNLLLRIWLFFAASPITDSF